MSHVRQPFENPVADVAEVRRLMLQVVMQVVAERVMGVRDAKRQFLRRRFDAVLRRVLPPLERAHERVRVVRALNQLRAAPRLDARVAHDGAARAEEVERGVEAAGCDDNLFVEPSHAASQSRTPPRRVHTSQLRASV